MRLLPSYNILNDFFDDTFYRPVKMATDIKETENDYILAMDLPGYQKEDITIQLKDDYLHIQANTQTNKEEKDEDGKIIRQERFRGQCSRSFYVGHNVKEEDIQAKFDNGELTITIPKNIPERIEEKSYIAIQ